MKENRLAQNNEILHGTTQFQRIPHYNGSSRWAAFLCIKIGTWQL
ncbi:hypothetical protein T01_13538 [Trichinella spiralis]|uniref:Uncharacterized protein n=1 Tax=Trichinella spiralis TaxID=6334 RepID=A0A0V1AGU0_TRISP|nr:hypothetical protein T01_13538 [Trichinella spiralis]